MRYCRIVYVLQFILVFACPLERAKRVLELDDKCLPPEETVNWSRTLHYNNQPFTLNIEVTDRPSHWIINYIFEILLRERLGYNQVRFIKTKWSSTETTLRRIKCSERPCSRPPAIHVNLEVWLAPGESISAHSPVTYHGALGPITRWGVFTNADSVHYWPTMVNNLLQKKWVSSDTEKRLLEVKRAQIGYRSTIFFDNPRMLADLIALVKSDNMSLPGKTRLLNTSALLNMTKFFDAEKIASTESGEIPFFLNWYPNSLTLNQTWIRLGLPDCAALRARPVSADQTRLEESSMAAENDVCSFEVNHLVKVAWNSLADAAPLIANLLNNLNIKQSDYIQLLNVTNHKFLNHTEAMEQNFEREFRRKYREIACFWVRRHTSTWKKWTSGWDRKKELTIVGMFSSTGDFGTLSASAYIAVDFLNGDQAYFNSTEYQVKLQVRNVSRSLDGVLDKFSRFLTERETNSTVLGVIAGLHSDSIEAIVELANLRRILVLSPTVESARFLMRRHYRYFFRTIPSMSTASFMLIRLFKKWGWRRISMFRRDDNFLDRKAFQGNNITIVHDFEMEESALTYAVAKKNLQTLKQSNGRIIIVDYSSRATAIVMCAAFHLGMRFEAGYVWFLNTWLTQKWWEGPNMRPPECTPKQMDIINAYYFTIGPQLHADAMAHQNLVIARPINTTHPGAAKPKRPSSTTTKLMQNCGHYTFESVMVLGSAISRLLHRNPSALSVLKSPEMAEEFRKLVSESDIGLSEGMLIDLAALSDKEHLASVKKVNATILAIDELAETLVFSLDGECLSKLPQMPTNRPRRSVPTPRTESPETAAQDEEYRENRLSTLRFNTRNERLANIWVLKQSKPSVVVPIIAWSHSAEDTDRIPGVLSPHSSPMNAAFSSTILMEGENDESDFASAYKQFVDGLNDSELDPPYWNLAGTLPGDGSKDVDCVFGFISRWFGVGCVVSSWIFSVTLIFFITVPLCISGVFHYRHKLKEAENSTRRPFDDLCAELADINIPSSDVVLNRQIGGGAFGLVYGGEAKRAGRWEAVAVKVITNKKTYESKVDFLSEAKLMRGLEHKNVVRLVGICVHRLENIYLIMELMLLGDLKSYLLARRITAQNDPNDEDIRPSTLTSMALDIAEGVAYLHRKHLIHRDIALRNCLVSTDRTVKLGDFGLTREFTTNSPDGYYRFTRNVVLPIRWMSPEAVQYGIFSVKSDLWSYGIVLYEIVTFGGFPYSSLGDVEVVEHTKRMEFSIADFLPANARDTVLWRLIVSCCQHHWQHRPDSMNEVIEAIRANDNCIRPYLTDDPPKANVYNPLPFLPGAGNCIMSDIPQVPQQTGRSSGVNLTLLHMEHMTFSRPLYSQNQHQVYNFTDPIPLLHHGGGAAASTSGSSGPSHKICQSGSAGGGLQNLIRHSGCNFAKLGQSGRVHSTPSSQVTECVYHNHRPQPGIRSSADFIADDFQNHMSEPNSPPPSLNLSPPVGVTGGCVGVGAWHSQLCYASPPLTGLPLPSSSEEAGMPTGTGSNSYSPGDLDAVTFFPHSRCDSNYANVEEKTALLNPSNRSLSAEFLQKTQLDHPFSFEPVSDSTREHPQSTGPTISSIVTHCTSCPLKSTCLIQDPPSGPGPPPLCNVSNYFQFNEKPVVEQQRRGQSFIRSAWRMLVTRWTSSDQLDRTSSRQASRHHFAGGVSMFRLGNPPTQHHRHQPREQSRSKLALKVPTSGKPGKERLSYGLANLDDRRKNSTSKSLPQVYPDCRTSVNLARTTCGSAGDAYFLAQSLVAGARGRYNHLPPSQNGILMTPHPSTDGPLQTPVTPDPSSTII